MSADTTNGKKWFAAIPLEWRGQEAFWEREAGVLCLGFRALGVESKLVLLGRPEVHPNLPLLVGTPQQFEDPAWWKQWGAEGVVLYSWAAPRYEPIACAIKSSGAKLVLRMDTDGVSSPRVWFGRYLSVAYFAFRDAGKKFAAPAALLKTLLFRLVPSAFDRGFLQHLSHADLILVESPVAKQRFQRLLRELGRTDLAEKVRMMPAQIVDDFVYDPAVDRRPQILAVGRWDATQKDSPMLMRVLGDVLAREPHYTALVAGAGTEGLHRLLAQQPATVQTRIKILGRVPHGQLRHLYQESQILFFSSRYEGFPNAAAEALCCGCSVVGPALIASLNYCASHSSGTTACSRSARDFSDALGAEIDAWRGGERNAREISERWRPRVSAKEVAARILGSFA